MLSEKKVAVIGYQGRMGQATLEALAQHSKLTLGAKVGRQELQNKDQCARILKSCHAIIDPMGNFPTCLTKPLSLNKLRAVSKVQI